MQNTSVLYRIDDRTQETGEDNIKDFSEREHLWSIALRINFIERGMPCNMVDWGVDGTGKFIDTKLNNYNADKKYIFVNGVTKLIEIKTNPEYNLYYQRFKVFLLDQYRKQGAAVVVPMLEGYYYYSNKVIPWMLSYPHKFHREFCNNKKTVKIPMEDIEAKIATGEIKYHKWTPKALAFIQENKYELTKDKKIDSDD